MGRRIAKPLLAQGYGLDGGLSPSWGWELFLFMTASRLALVPTQLPVQWAPESHSLEVKRPRREADHSPPHVPR